MRISRVVLQVAVGGLACALAVANAGELAKPPNAGEKLPPPEQPKSESTQKTNAIPTPGEQRTFAGIEFCWIPAGTFTMGSPKSEVGRQENELQHPVTISKGFWLGKYEVTQAQWEAAMGNNPSHFIDSKRPVERVSYDDCQKFIDKLNQGGEGSFRLPTESEWEYACRAGTTSAFSFGDNLDAFWDYGLAQKKAPKRLQDDRKENGELRQEVSDEDEDEDEDEEKGAAPVGSFKPNAWGLYDMHGNILEWCSDWFGEYPNGPVTDPQGPKSDHLRTARGGNWGYGPVFCRSAFRNHPRPDRSYGTLGLRLVRTQD